MLATNYNNFIKNPNAYFDSVADCFEPLIVTRNDKNMVILSQSMYDSIVETIYLMGNKNNYDHLEKSIAELKQD